MMSNGFSSLSSKHCETCAILPFFFRAAPMAYGGFQARGQTGAGGYASLLQISSRKASFIDNFTFCFHECSLWVPFIFYVYAS